MFLDAMRFYFTRKWLAAWLPRSRRHLLRPIDPYVDWRQHNRMTPLIRDALLDEIEALQENLPLISVIMPVYKPDLDIISAAIKSVQNQIFARWELCICDDGSSNEILSEKLDAMAIEDSRIKLTNIANNSGISAATNAAALLARGEFLIFLDQDDILTPDCLAHFAIAFARSSTTDVAYSDSDKLDSSGDRQNPCFKPGWSPILLLSHMYPSHAIAVRSCLFWKVQGMRSAFDGSQDYDLMLRAVELARGVQHIPHILYHWRALSGSTALSADQKPHSIAAGERAVCEALQRRGIPATVERPDWAERAAIGLFRLKFDAPTQPIKLIVYSPDGAMPDMGWLSKVAGDLPGGSSIYWASTRNCVLSREHIEQISIKPAPANLSFAAQLTHVLSQDNRKLAVLLRVGATPLNHDWLAQLVGYSAFPGIGLVGARVIEPNGRVANAGFVLPEVSERPEPAFAGLKAQRPGAMYLARTTRECFAVAATCLAINGARIGRIVPVPDDVQNDVTLGLWLSQMTRSRGLSVLCCPYADVEAVGQQSDQSLPRVLGVDAWYNRNLGLGRYLFKPARRAAATYRSRPVRVAVVSHNLDREGAQSLLVDLLRALKMDGLIDPVVVSPQDGELRKDLVDLDIPVYLVKPCKRRATGAMLKSRVAELRELFLETGAEVVIANTLEMYAAVEAAQRAGLGVIWWQHEGGQWHRFFRLLCPHARAHAFSAFNAAYRVVQVAESTRLGWLPLALRDNFELIRHGKSPESLKSALGRWTKSEARRKLRLTPTDYCVLVLGSISERKGQLDMVNALAALPTGVAQNIRIKLVGALVDRSYGDKLEAALSRLAPARRKQIELVGRVPDTALYYRAADALFCCSRQESAPMVILEAMNFSLPIVSTSVDGIPAMVKFGTSAINYESGDVPHLAQILVELAASLGLSRMLGRAGKNLALRTNGYVRMTERFASLIHEAASLRSSAGSDLPLATGGRIES